MSEAKKTDSFINKKKNERSFIEKASDSAVKGSKWMLRKALRPLGYGVMEEIFPENEKNANRTVWVFLIANFFMYVAALYMGLIGLVTVDMHRLLVFSLGYFAVVLITYVYYEFMGGRNRKSTKYFLMLIFILDGFVCYSLYKNELMILVAMVLSCRYSSRKFSAFSCGMGLINLVSAYLLNAPNEPIDLNVVQLIPGAEVLVQGTFYDSVMAAGIVEETLVNNTVIFSMLPNLMFDILVMILCIQNAHNSYERLVDQAGILAREAEVSSELDIAAGIQNSMLERDFEGYSVYAIMDPAKEVGGDFYDFFKLHDGRTAIIVGDVSEKGLPAAMYMATSRLCIRDNSLLGMGPDRVFEYVNEELYHNNERGMFITSWMAFIDSETGKTQFVNAGHNPPVLVKHNGECSLLKTKPNLFLAGMGGMKYDIHEITLEKGDKIMLYTDGVTEARNPEEELFGDERMLNYIREHYEGSPKEILEGLKAEVDAFSGNIRQFDDITMLMYEMV